MDQWTSKKNETKDCNDMTMSSPKQDTTAGAGRGIFSNTHGDVPGSIFQQRHTANTQPTYDNVHYNRDYNHNNEGKKEQQPEGDKEQQQKRKMKEDDSEMSSGIIQESARSLNSGDPFDELLMHTSS